MVEDQSKSGWARTVLVTGGSTGIGLELAHLFARDGYSLILVARDKVKLEQTAEQLRQEHSVEVQSIVCDLSGPSAATSLFDKIVAQGKQIDVLVNNAGFGVYGLFVENDHRREWEMIAVNIVALTQLTALVLPGMIERGRGQILNVASTAAFQPGPLMAVYYASKAYVLSFSMALVNELKETGVSVTTLCPGPTRTEFQNRADVAETRLFTGVVMSAEAVARAGYIGMQKNRPVVIPGAHNKLLGILSRVAPRRLLLTAVRWIQERRRE
jgi:uncharacterized protein